MVLFPSCVSACESHTYDMKLNGVVDGDTVLADIELGLGVTLKNEVVRLYGIDAPEIKGGEKETGVKVKNFVEKTLESSKRITVKIDPQWGKEKYGRRLGVIYAQGVNLNESLIELKLARRIYY